MQKDRCILEIPHECWKSAIFLRVQVMEVVDFSSYAKQNIMKYVINMPSAIFVDPSIFFSPNDIGRRRMKHDFANQTK